MTEAGRTWLIAVGEAMAPAQGSRWRPQPRFARVSARNQGLSVRANSPAPWDPPARGPRLTVERLGERARQLRDELDLAGVRDRESELHDKRYLKFTKLSDGMTRVHGLLDPESAATSCRSSTRSHHRGGAGRDSSIRMRWNAPSRSCATSAPTASSPSTRSSTWFDSALPRTTAESSARGSPPCTCSSPSATSPPARESPSSRDRPRR